MKKGDEREREREERKLRNPTVTFNRDISLFSHFPTVSFTIATRGHHRKQ
jgi:hypothetical protein